MIMIFAVIKQPFLSALDSERASLNDEFQSLLDCSVRLCYQVGVPDEADLVVTDTISGF